MDNAAIASVLAEIADLLEIRGDNPFKIRAYRAAADTVVAEPTPVARLDETALRALPGVGRDLAQRIHEIATTGDTVARQELLRELPAGLLEVLRLQGVGPKTVKRLYDELHVESLDQLEAAARAGRIAGLRGLGAKKEQLVLRAIEERRRYAGKHLSALVERAAQAILSELRRHGPEGDFVPVGSLRRGVEVCGDLDILAVGAGDAVMDALVGHSLVTRVLGRGDTKASVLLSDGLQADLRLVAPEHRGAALQYFTGSKAHNIALRDRALSRGLRLNEYGLFRIEDGSRIAGPTEEGIYEALDLAWVPPELRELRGELEAAAAGNLPELVTLGDLQGDLHAHTTATDGRDDIETMGRAARAAGLKYLAITDHSKSLAMANGLDERRALTHAARIRDIGSRLAGITLLAGIECDILPDGALDLDADCLSQLDVVVASVHTAFGMDAAAMTDRLLRAIEHPAVHVLGHPTGRILLRREPQRFDVEAVVDAAARHGVAIEINCQIHRLDAGDGLARLARERGCRLVVSSDAHSTAAFATLEGGLRIARRAWAGPGDVLNCLPLRELKRALKRRPASAGAARR